jgi:hypothetical protein
VLGTTIGECGSALETLLLGWNHIGNKGADEILAGFARVKPVTRISRLDLSMNSLSKLNNLQSFLSGTRTLTLVALNLSHNQLGPKVAEDLVTALSVRNRVQELKIGFNPLGLIGKFYVCAAGCCRWKEEKKHGTLVFRVYTRVRSLFSLTHTHILSLTLLLQVLHVLWKPVDKMHCVHCS